MRIAYFIESLYNSGGMERIITRKANYLADIYSYEVTIVTYAQKPETKDFFSLSPNVNRVRLHDEGGDLYNLISDWIAENPQDVCISTYGREFNVLPKLGDISKKIVEFHFCHDINKFWLANRYGERLSRVLGAYKTYTMKQTAKKYDKIVVLTDADKRKWNYHKVAQIYNPSTVEVSGVSECIAKVVTAVGRMDRQKGFDFLIDSWAIVEKKNPDWILDIYGGGDSLPYKKQIERLGLKNVRLNGRTSDIGSVYKDSSIYVLSSRYEGFSLTIFEAMSCGLPIITFDCPSGPAELVGDGDAGFVIKEVGDIQTMADRINYLIENPDERIKMGKAAKNRTLLFSDGEIMAKWDNLFRSIVSN